MSSNFPLHVIRASDASSISADTSARVSNSSIETFCSLKGEVGIEIASINREISSCVTLLNQLIPNSSPRPTSVRSTSTKRVPSLKRGKSVRNDQGCSDSEHDMSHRKNNSNESFSGPLFRAAAAVITAAKQTRAKTPWRLGRGRDEDKKNQEIEEKSTRQLPGKASIRLSSGEKELRSVQWIDQQGTTPMSRRAQIDGLDRHIKALCRIVYPQAVQQISQFGRHAWDGNTYCTLVIMASLQVPFDFLLKILDNILYICCCYIYI